MTDPVKCDDSVPPIWEMLAKIGEAAPAGAFPDSPNAESNRLLALDIARLEGKLEAFSSAMIQCTKSSSRGRGYKRKSEEIFTSIAILHLNDLQELAKIKKWWLTPKIGEAALPSAFPGNAATEYEAKLARLGSVLLANLISQQRFDEPHIEWLDFMNFATEFGLAVEHPTRDDDLCWNRVF